MHPRISELRRYLDDQTRALRAAYDGVPEPDRGVRPSPDRWSPAEVVAHLAIVERRIAQRIMGLVDEARTLPPEDDPTPILPSINLKRVEVRTDRFKTSAASEPQEVDPMHVWDDFADARRAMDAAIVAGDGLALGKVSAPHPVLGPFTGYEWIAFVGSHCARHADQIRQRNVDP